MALSKGESHNSKFALFYLGNCAQNSETCLRAVLKDPGFLRFLLSCAEKVPKDLRPLLRKVIVRCDAAREEQLEKEKELSQKRASETPSTPVTMKKAKLSDANDEDILPGSMHESPDTDMVSERNEKRA